VVKAEKEYFNKNRECKEKDLLVKGKSEKNKRNDRRSVQGGGNPREFLTQNFGEKNAVEFADPKKNRTFQERVNQQKTLPGVHLEEHFRKDQEGRTVRREKKKCQKTRN